MTAVKRANGTGGISVRRDGSFLLRWGCDGERRSRVFRGPREEAERILGLITAGVSVDEAFPVPQSRSFVYFIQDGTAGPVKIGVTTNLRARLADLLVASSQRRLTVLAVVPGGHQLEQAFQAAFAADRIRGEWFEPTPKLLRLVAELAAIWPLDGVGAPRP